MANAPPQFTPAQILEAGQRAEADGRFEHAKQFYRHIVEHYPHTSEFALARDGIGRLGTRAGWAGGTGDVRHGRGYDRGYDQTYDQSGHARAADGADDYAHTRGRNAGWIPADENGAPYNRPAEYSGYAAGDQPMPASTEDQRRIQIAPAGYDPGEHVFDDEVYEPRKRYRIGRVLAALLTFLGLVMLIGGGALTGLVIAVPERVSAALAGVPVLPGIIVFVGPSLLTVGFVVCLVGQLARALFDTADATRNAAEMQAARLSGRTAHARRSSGD